MLQRERNSLGYVVGGISDEAQAVFGTEIGGKIVDIYSVARGLSCGCHCLNCGALLVAKQGDERAWHFAHDHRNPSCSSAKVRAMHADLYLRRLLERGRIELPHPRYTGEQTSAEVLEVYASGSVEESSYRDVRTRCRVELEPGKSHEANVAILLRLVKRKGKADRLATYQSETMSAMEIDLTGDLRSPDERLEHAILRSASRRWIWKVGKPTTARPLSILTPSRLPRARATELLPARSSFPRAYGPLEPGELERLREALARPLGSEKPDK